INNYRMLLQAAMNGQGLALAWGSLLDDYLQSCALVRPVETVVRTQANFSMLEPADRGVLPSNVKHFRSSLLDHLPGQVRQQGLS
ncbi:LysR family transcriptional regulator, partial [Acinetobacter baumannii]